MSGVFIMLRSFGLMFGLLEFLISLAIAKQLAWVFTEKYWSSNPSFHEARVQAILWLILAAVSHLALKEQP